MLSFYSMILPDSTLQVSLAGREKKQENSRLIRVASLY